MPVFVTTVFIVSLAALCGMFGLVAIEQRVGRRLILSRMRGESDARIVATTDAVMRVSGKVLHNGLALCAQATRAGLATAILRGRRLSARLRDLAEKRRAAPGANRGVVSNYLETLSETKKEIHSEENPVQ